jgi:hypothetical protein
MGRKRFTPGSPAAGARIARALVESGKATLIVLSIIAVMAGISVVLIVVLAPGWCDVDLASCERAAQAAAPRRPAGLLGACLFFATPALAVLFYRMTRARPAAPWPVARRLLGCLAGYLIPVAVILFAWF